MLSAPRDPAEKKEEDLHLVKGAKGVSNNMAYDDKMATGWGPKKWVRELQLNGSQHPAQWFSAGGDLSPQGTFRNVWRRLFD